MAAEERGDSLPPLGPNSCLARFFPNSYLTKNSLQAAVLLSVSVSLSLLVAEEEEILSICLLTVVVVVCFLEIEVYVDADNELLNFKTSWCGAGAWLSSCRATAAHVYQPDST